MINFILYVQSKDGNTDWTFPTVKDQSQLLISHAKSSKVCQATWYLLPKSCNDVATEKYGVFAKCFCSEIPVPGLLETLYCLFFVLKCTNISKVAERYIRNLVYIWPILYLWVAFTYMIVSVGTNSQIVLPLQQVPKFKGLPWFWLGTIGC
jgi:hypothetical protein